jgi:hypothetical protein
MRPTDSIVAGAVNPGMAVFGRSPAITSKGRLDPGTRDF